MTGGMTGGMTGDLGAAAGEVHDQAAVVRDFWFGLSNEQQFAKDEALDTAVPERFGAMRNAALTRSPTAEELACLAEPGAAW